MAIVSCACGKSYRLQDGLAGKTFRCKGCNAKLTVPPDGTPTAPPPVAAAPLRPFEVDPTLVGGQGTVAGNPGLLTFNLRQFCKCYLVFLWAGLVAGIAIGAFAWFKTGSMAIAGAAVPFTAVVTFLSAADRHKKQFRGGNLCAALVLGTDPYTVAVLSDLSTGRSGPKLAVAIRRQPLGAMFGGPPKAGAGLTAVSFYVGHHGNDHWDDFMPKVVNCACTDRRQIDRANGSIDPDDWALLERLAPKLRRRPLGLVRLWESPELAAAT